MRRQNALIVCCALASLLVGATTYLHAEVSGPYDSIIYIIMGITEGADPIDGSAWQPVRNPGVNVLNPDGFDRDDGTPDLMQNNTTGQPEAVWPYDTGTDFEIAFSRNTEQGWGDKEFLSSSAADDLDPRLSIDASGKVYVVWWEAVTERIYLVTREPGETEWSVPELIVEGGRRPSVVAFSGTRLIAYERDALGGGQAVVVQMSKTDGTNSLEVSAQTARTEPLNVVLHVLNGRVWMEWKHSDNQFAYSEFINGVWVAPATTPWVDTSWIGVEDVRRTIQHELFSN